MAVTVSTQSNPTPQNVGKDLSKATLINSGFSSGTVEYHIQTIQQTNDMHVYSAGIAASGNVVSRTSAQLAIILPGRIRYRARARQTGGGSWTAWVEFKSRDRVYCTPDAITQLITDEAASATGAQQTVTNSAKASSAASSTGVTVTNTDYWYVTTTNIAASATGVTVTNSE